MNYFMGFIAGGGLVALVMLIARKGFPEHAGVVMTFPVVAFLSLVFASPSQTMKIAGWGVAGAVALLFFLGTFSVLMLFWGPERKYISLFVALMAWFCVISIVSLFMKG